jgi:eukaryotic-like serine/threonine-protein kinase
LTERLGKYELVSKIGQGGMAEVYLAKAALAEGLFKLVVVKKIHRAFSSSPHFARMFRSEAQIATWLDHPNVVQMFDFGKEGGDLYLVMEYVDGHDLMRLVKMAHQAGQRMPYGIAAYVVQELLKGLDYAHRKASPTGDALDIVHRDVSPQNVLVSTDGAVKIVDFGIAKTRTQAEEEGVVKGKFAYMSPEQAAGLTVDRRCDIFAAGIILYELLAGRTLFGGIKGDKALEAVRTADIPPPTEVDKNVPESLVPIVMRALERQLDRRYATARDFQHVLTKWLYSQDEIYDTGALAAFVHRVAPAETKEGRGSSSPVTMAPGGVSQIGVEPGFRDSSVPAPLGTRGDTEPIVERKRVVLVCANFSEPENATRNTDQRFVEAVGRFTEVAEGIVFKSEALVDDLTVTGMTAVVGLPVSTDEDPTRAVELASTLVEAFNATCADFRAAGRIGVSVTRGFAKVTRQSDGSYSYRISSQLVQLGFLLSGRADHGEVLLDDAVRKAAADEFKVGEVPLLSDKLREARAAISALTDPGSASLPARVFRVEGVLEGPPEEAKAKAMFGRVLELKALEDIFWNVQRSQRGRAVVVYGDKGMGKRTLVRAFLSKLEGWEGQIIRMVARPANRVSAHALLSEIALQLIIEDDRLEGEALRQRIKDVAVAVDADSSSERSHVFVHSLEVLLELASDTAISGLDPDQLDREVQDALGRLLRWRSKRSPLVLLLENAHLASTHSLRHVAELALRMRDRPIFAVLTAVPRKDGDEVLEGVTGQAIILGELAPDARKEMVLARFVDPKEAAPLAERVLAQAGGNPYYIEALLESLVEQGVCSPDTQDVQSRLRWTRQETQLQIPASVEGLVSSRLDRLPAEMREVLRQAAVLGRVFETAHLKILAGHSVDDALGELERRRMVYSIAGHQGRWAFYQQVIQEVAYQSIDPDMVSTYHLDAARVFQEDSRYQPGAWDARVGRQLALGGHKEEAVSKYLSAARHARHISGNRESFQLMTLALELQPADPRILFDIHKEREQILRGWGRRRKQEQEVQSLVSISEQMGEKDVRAVALGRALQFDQDGGRANRVLTQFDQAMAAAVAAGDPLLQADALRLRARALNDLGRNDEALDSAGKALQLLPDDAEGKRLRGEVLHTQGNIRFYTGKQREAVESYAEALALFRKLEFRRLEATMLMNIGFVSQCMGEYEGALRYYQDSYNIDLEIGDRFYTGAKLANIGQAHAEMGQFERAEKYLRKAGDLCRAVEDTGGLSDAITTLGQMRLWQGRVADARKYLSKAVDLSRQAESAYSEMRARIYLAMAKHEAGEPHEAALKEAEVATELSRRSDMPQGVVFGTMVTATILADMGKLDEALSRSSEAMSVIATGTPIVGVEEPLHVHAKLLRDAGRLSEAKPFLQRAVDEIRKKVRRIKQDDRRDSFLSVRSIREVVTTYTQLVGPADELIPRK